MRKILKYVISVLIIGLLLLFFFKTDIFFEAEATDDSITLLKAYKLGLEYAREIDRQAELLHMNSVDDDKKSGLNGKKENWQMLIVLPNKNKRVGITIENQKITRTQMLEGASSSYFIIRENEMKFDSDEAVKKAINEFSLEPGGKDNYLFNGYHFKLIKDNDILFLTVVGDKNDTQMEVHFDATTGKYLGRTEHH